jgi:hypothetical protein
VNILDENIIDSQRHLLKSWRFSIRQIGYEVGRQGIEDEEIIPLLHQLRRPTFFTRDSDFYRRDLCHPEYCLVHLSVKMDEAAFFIRRLLRHQEFNTIRKRMGCVIRVMHSGLSVWRRHQEGEAHFRW